MNGSQTASKSMFVAGLLIGALVTIACFSFMQRSAVNREQAEQAEFMKQIASQADQAVQAAQAGINQIASRATVLKLAHSLNQQHPVHLAMVHMAERLEEISGGAVKMEIFSDGQLGGETQCIEQLQRGSLDLTKASTSPMESFVPAMAVFSLPYIFLDETQFWKVLESPIGKEMLVAGSERGLRGLCYYDAGARSFYSTKKPVLEPADLKGMKIRVQKSPTAMAMIQAFGGSPTPIPWGELYSALQQGVVDGAENNLPSFYSSRHFEVCKHLSLNEHTRVPDILLMSQKRWESLPANIQGWVQQAADESCAFERELWAKSTEECAAKVQEAGVTIYHPDKTKFAACCDEMYKEYEGTEVGDLIKKFREIK